MSAARESMLISAAAALAFPWLLLTAASAGAQAQAAVDRPADEAGPPATAGAPADAEIIRVYFDPSTDPGAREQAAEEPGKRVRRGYLGVELIELTPELRAHFGAPEDAGVMIARVVSGSPADRVGLRVGDIITALDGVPVKSSADARAGVRPLDEGALLAIEVRRDGQPQVMTANVEQRERREADHGSLQATPAMPSSPAAGGAAAEGVSRTARTRLQPLKTPREELLEKKLKALEKRLNELESRIPKS
jgi:membrane-associated protease RseP (regulator of RpoE activity)